MSAIATAAYGMIAAANRFDSSAQRTATFGAADETGEAAPEVDPAAETVDQITASTDFAANAAVLRTANAMAGSLLDIKV
ncbi:MAG: protein of unknown function domain protein [Caulobacter sp.]|nr:protein of unknown function domain protein [Caulobacter sp.]